MVVSTGDNNKMYVISMAASRQIFSEWIDLVPGYRIFGFGSDVLFPELVCGHFEIARSCVVDVLTAKVKPEKYSGIMRWSYTKRKNESSVINQT